MSDVERLYFLDKLKSTRQCLNLLARCLCEFHPSSRWALFLWNNITDPQPPKKDKLIRLMFGLGRSSPDLSAFNLNIGCMSQLDFFRSCPMPDLIPEFASQSLLSRPCNASVSWEKVMLKLDEAFQVETLTDEATMRATLACRILILIEAEETRNSVLRVGESGRRLLNEVLPCPVKVSKVWPATSMAFYVIFSWIKRRGMEDRAMNEFIDSNESKMADKVTSHRIVHVKLVKSDTIMVQLTPVKGSCSHILNVMSSLDYSSG